jgi:hypothetical protein
MDGYLNFRDGIVVYEDEVLDENFDGSESVDTTFLSLALNKPPQTINMR